MILRLPAGHRSARSLDRITPVGRLVAAGIVAAAAAIAFLLAETMMAADLGDLRLNQIQVIGTHNSYHRAPAPGLLRWLALAGQANARAFDYTHRPLSEQFTLLQIRQIELDLFADPQGGHYASPAYFRLLREQGLEPGPDPNAGGVLEAPGLKVFHVQDVDFLSTTPTFIHALTQVRDWSRAHPRHVPLLILVELKDETHPLLPTRPVPFERAQVEQVDGEIRRVFSRAELFVPDDLRRDCSTLPEAIRRFGWPRVDELRGRILFALDNEDAIRDRYLEDHPALRERLMFASVSEDHPAAAWFKVNDAPRDFARIQRLVQAGFVVRTRADTGPDDARHHRTSRRDQAFASGAQWISTDYPEPRSDWSAYQVRWEDGGEFRRNPVTAPPPQPSGE